MIILRFCLPLLLLFPADHVFGMSFTQRYEALGESQNECLSGEAYRQYLDIRLALDSLDQFIEILKQEREQLGYCYIVDLDEKQLLQELFIAAKPKWFNILGWLSYKSTDLLTDDELEQALKKSYIGSLKGRFMGINMRLFSGHLDVFHYNRVNGKNAAQKVIAKLGAQQAAENQAQ